MNATLDIVGKLWLGQDSC